MNLIVLLAIIFLIEAVIIAFAPKNWFTASKHQLYAKFTPGAIISEIRNKIAATVFSKNKAGAIIRNRITPINRRTTVQTEARQLLASLASSWRGLTQSERDGWNSASPNFPQTDSLGQTVLLTGEQLYVRSNANLIQIAEPQITSAPPPTSFAILSFDGIVLTVAAFTVGFLPDPVPVGFSLVFRATRPVSAGKQFFGQSEFRFVSFAGAGDVSPKDLFAQYVAIFGDLTGLVGSKVAIEMFLVEEASGLAGIPVRATQIIA